MICPHSPVLLLCFEKGNFQKQFEPTVMVCAHKPYSIPLLWKRNISTITWTKETAILDFVS